MLDRAGHPYFHRIYVIHYSTYTRVLGSVSIHSLRTVVLDYGELLAYWFTLHFFFLQISLRSTKELGPFVTYGIEDGLAIK
jgi:hypothetical protein